MNNNKKHFKEQNSQPPHKLLCFKKVCTCCQRKLLVNHSVLIYTLQIPQNVLKMVRSKSEMLTMQMNLQGDLSLIYKHTMTLHQKIMTTNNREDWVCQYNPLQWLCVYAPCPC